MKHLLGLGCTPLDCYYCRYLASRLVGLAYLGEHNRHD